MAQLTGYAQLFGGDTSATASTQIIKLGTRAMDSSGNEYIYLKGTASVTKNTWVSFDEGLNVTLLASDNQGRVGVAMAATPLSSFGWYQIYGQGVANAAGAVGDNSKLFATATAGTVDSEDITGDFIVGAIARSAIAGGSATVELLYPIVQDVAFN